jgi:hypothetical protein
VEARQGTGVTISVSLGVTDSMFCHFRHALDIVGRASKAEDWRLAPSPRNAGRLVGNCWGLAPSKLDAI